MIAIRERFFPNILRRPFYPKPSLSSHDLPLPSLGPEPQHEYEHADRVAARARPTTATDRTELFTSVPCSLSYPVGENMSAALTFAREAAKVFTSINEYRKRPVNLICRGSSGAILAALFSSAIPNKTYVVHVKKPGETSHASSDSVHCSMMVSGRINVIIDDFIATGSTMDAIFGEIRQPRVHIIIAMNSSSFPAYQCKYSISSS